MIDRKKFLKKFSFGLSLNITMEEYKKILSKYKPYLSSAYFSLPLGKEFHTRIGVVQEYDQEDADKKLMNILGLLKDNNIKLEVVINQYNLREELLISAIEYLKNVMEIDAICTLDEYVDIIRQYFPKIYLVSSFNNLKRNYDDIKNTNKQYNQIVIGKNFMRDDKAMKLIKDSGFDIKLLLNNGCSFNCLSCRKGYECKNIFNQNLRHCTINELYAIQSFLPFELQYLEDKIEIDRIKEFKLSSRPCTYEYLDNCLGSYLMLNNEYYYVNQHLKNYHLWCRLAHFNEFYGQLDLDEIIKIKEELWK